MLFQHTTILELVVGSDFMVRAWFLQHFIEDASIWGASRLLPLHGGDEIVVEVLLLELPHFLLLLVFLEPSTGGPVFISRLLAFPSFTTVEGTDCFFPCCVVCVGYFKRKQKNPQAHGYRCSFHPGVFQSIDFPQRT